MKPIGGTELLYNNLIKYVGRDWEKEINLILSFTDPNMLDPNRKNIVWQHLYTDQGAAQGMAYPQFTNFVDHYVYVSNWQLTEYKKTFNVDGFSNYVIKNAIEPIEFKEKPTDKIKLIYTSMPDRGLEVLLDAWRILNRNDVELIVYSSNIIYGKSYSDSRRGFYDKLFNTCKLDPNISYKGFGINQAVRKALQGAHILAYPSIYPETSCLAAVEAGAAGCKIVTTDFGALPETCGGRATHVPYIADFKKLAENYAEQLNSSIDNYWADSYNIIDQSNWFNETYSWTNRAHDWKTFFKNICAK